MKKKPEKIAEVRLHANKFRSQARPRRPSQSCPPATPVATSQASLKISQLNTNEKPIQGSPSMDLWMKHIVVLKLKEVNRRMPEMRPEGFGWKMVLDQNYPRLIL